MVMLILTKHFWMVAYKEPITNIFPYRILLFGYYINILFALKPYEYGLFMFISVIFFSIFGVIVYMKYRS